MKRSLLLLGIVLAVGVMLATPVGAKPSRKAPIIDVLQPTVTCVGNDITVAAEVTTDGTMEALSMRVDRWEEITTPPFYMAGQLETVEMFIAELPTGGNDPTPVATSHSLVTSDPETWRVRLYFDPATYVDTSDLWEIFVNAWASHKRAQAEGSFRGVYDCGISDWIEHSHPTENIEYGNL